MSPADSATCLYALKIQLARIMSDAEPRRTVSRTGRAAVVIALALAMVAFVLAQWPPVRRASFDDLETVSMGQNLLIAGALPWLLQWGALAVLFGWLASSAAYLDRRTILAVVLLPLAVGASWWIGIAATHWGEDPLDALTTSTLFWMSRGLGAETIVQGALFEILGPLTCPLLLHGPYVMAGGSFLWTAASTALVILLFGWTARTLKVMKDGRHANLRSIVLVVAASLVYSLPVLLRVLLRVVSDNPAI